MSRKPGQGGSGKLGRLDAHGPAPVRGYIDELLPDVLEGRTEPGRVFHRTGSIEDAGLQKGSIRLDGPVWIRASSSAFQFWASVGTVLCAGMQRNAVAEWSGRGMAPRVQSAEERKYLQTGTFRLVRDEGANAQKAGGRLRPRWQQKMPICRVFSTGATGLEPATPGVTGRSWWCGDKRG